MPHSLPGRIFAWEWGKRKKEIRYRGTMTSITRRKCEFLFSANDRRHRTSCHHWPWKVTWLSCRTTNNGHSGCGLRPRYVFFYSRVFYSLTSTYQVVSRFARHEEVPGGGRRGQRQHRAQMTRDARHLGPRCVSFFSISSDFVIYTTHQDPVWTHQEASTSTHTPFRASSSPFGQPAPISSPTTRFRFPSTRLKPPPPPNHAFDHHDHCHHPTKANAGQRQPTNANEGRQSSIVQRCSRGLGGLETRNVSSPRYVLVACFIHAKNILPLPEHVVGPRQPTTASTGPRQPT